MVIRIIKTRKQDKKIKIIKRSHIESCANNVTNKEKNKCMWNWDCTQIYLIIVSICTKCIKLLTSRAGKFCAFTFFSFCTFFYQTNRKTEQNILPNENIAYVVIFFRNFVCT